MNFSIFELLRGALHTSIGYDAPTNLNYFLIPVSLLFMSFFVIFIYFKDFLYKFYFQINENSYVKSLKKSIVISSLLLILIKFIMYTTFSLRLYMFFFFTLLSWYFNLRERIKPLLLHLTVNGLGSLFYVSDISATTKENLLYSKLINKSNLEKSLLNYVFKIKLFFHYIFQQIYIFITWFRLLADTYIKSYFFIYYLFIFFIIYLDKSIIISIISLFFITTKLFVYLSEESLNEIKYKFYQMNISPSIFIKNLKINYHNARVLLYWNIRNASRGIFNEPYDDFSIINTLAYFKIDISGEIFQYKEDCSKQHISPTLPIVPSVPIGTQHKFLKEAKNTEYHSFFSKFMGHDVLLTKKKLPNNYWRYSMDSYISSSDDVTTRGSQIVGQNYNSKEELTLLAPGWSFDFDDEQKGDEFIYNNFNFIPGKFHYNFHNKFPEVNNNDRFDISLWKHLTNFSIKLINLQFSSRQGYKTSQQLGYTYFAQCNDYHKNPIEIVKKKIINNECQRIDDLLINIPKGSTEYNLLLAQKYSMNSPSFKNSESLADIFLGKKNSNSDDDL